jgi:hypothetical protein
MKAVLIVTYEFNSSRLEVLVKVLPSWFSEASKYLVQ